MPPNCLPSTRQRNHLPSNEVPSEISPANYEMGRSRLERAVEPAKENEYMKIQSQAAKIAIQRMLSSTGKGS